VKQQGGARGGHGMKSSHEIDHPRGHECVRPPLTPLQALISLGPTAAPGSSTEATSQRQTPTKLIQQGLSTALPQQVWRKPLEGRQELDAVCEPANSFRYPERSSSWYSFGLRQRVVRLMSRLLERETGTGI